MSPCEDYAAVQKHRKYDASFEGMNYYFCAMVFETFGAINDQGEDVMRQLFTFAAQHLGREFSSFCSRGWARVSCCLQRSVAQMIANRIDGQVGAPEPASESFVVSGGGLDVAFEQLEEGKGGERNGGGEPLGTGPLVGSVVRLTPTPVALAPAPLAPAPLAPTPVAPALLTPARVAAAPTTPAPLALARLASPLASPSRFPASSVGGVNPIRGDGFCGYYCVAAMDALMQDPRALDAGFDCSPEVLVVTRKRILESFGEWWQAKRVFYASDAEMEEEEVVAHVGNSSQVFRDRLNGGDMGKKCGDMAWPCDLALYALKTDVLVVLLDAQRLAAGKCVEAKVCEELQFDPLGDAVKKRVICIVVQ